MQTEPSPLLENSIRILVLIIFHIIAFSVSVFAFAIFSTEEAVLFTVITFIGLLFVFILILFLQYDTSKPISSQQWLAPVMGIGWIIFFAISTALSSRNIPPGSIEPGLATFIGFWLFIFSLILLYATHIPYMHTKEKEIEDELEDNELRNSQE